LRELAAEGNLASRIAAIDQLGALKDRGSIALLRKLAQDPVETLRAASRRALDKIGA
jgi:HEAT repeat protein